MTSVDQPYAGLGKVADLRQRVATLIRQQSRILVVLSNEALQDRWGSRLTDLAAIVEADSFRVMVLGQFSRGKSTLINALLGRQVLPSHATETTAIINSVKYGEQ